MEMEEVLNSLETLKLELQKVANANACVERTVSAAQSLCNAFRESADRMASFRGNLEEVYQEVDVLKKGLVSLIPDFDEKVTATCHKLERNVEEFHQELDSFDKKFARTSDRVDASVKNLSTSLSDGFLNVQSDVKDGVGRMISASKDSEIMDAVASVSSDITTLTTDTASQAEKTSARFQHLNEQVDSVEKSVGKGDKALHESFDAFRSKQSAIGKLVIALLFLSTLQAIGLVALAAYMLR